MDSSLISKYEKARQYAEEPERIHVEVMRVRFDGRHAQHAVEFRDGSWNCDCEFHRGHGTCPHVMATERVLGAHA